MKRPKTGREITHPPTADGSRPWEWFAPGAFASGHTVWQIIPAVPALLEV
jgi:hypothetical protein